MAQFPTVRMGKLTLRNMQKKFGKNYEAVFSFFSMLFIVNVVTVETDFSFRP
jgi:hypothetical protein